MNQKEFISYNDKLYWIYRKPHQSDIVEGQVQFVKELWHCDIVVKHKNQESDLLLFLREIPEAEIVTETQLIS